MLIKILDFLFLSIVDYFFLEKILLQVIMIQ